MRYANVEGPRVLVEQAEPAVADRAALLAATGQATWVWDPEHEGVLGLVKPGTWRALVVVYLAGSSPSVPRDDFEVAEEFYPAH